MKQYRLLKDIPFVKAGEILEIYHSDDKKYLHIFDENREEIYKFKIGDNVAKMHNEWFEEVREYFYIDSKGDIEYAKYEWNEEVVELRKLIGNYFETIEEAEKYLEYLKAKEVIKQDTKGFRPDWNDPNQPKYYGYWHFEKNEPDWSVSHMTKTTSIYFESAKAIEESFEKHPEDWKTYLTYEQ